MASSKKATKTVLLLLLLTCFLMGLLIPTVQPHPISRRRSPYSSRRDFVASHNAARFAVGVGPVEWNRTVAAYAREYATRRAAEGCGMVHSGGPYGENLAAGWSHMTGGEAVRLWAEEGRQYDRALNACFGGDFVCGHFTQVVWRSSVRLGCARAKCPNGWMFVICSYDPPGNYVGERPY